MISLECFITYVLIGNCESFMNLQFFLLQYFNMQSREEKTKIVEFWIHTKSYGTVRRKIILHFGLTGSEKKAAPKNRTIKCVVEHWRKYGSVHQMRKGRSGHLRTVKTPAKMQQLGGQNIFFLAAWLTRYISKRFQFLIQNGEPINALGKLLRVVSTRM